MKIYKQYTKVQLGTVPNCTFVPKMRKLFLFCFAKALLLVAWLPPVASFGLILLFLEKRDDPEQNHCTYYSGYKRAEPAVPMNT